MSFVTNLLHLTNKLKQNTMKTKQDVEVNFMNYGKIIVPKGTQLTHETACGINVNYHFVNAFSWIKKNYPEISYMLTHDAKFYGIDIPKEFVEY